MRRDDAADGLALSTASVRKPSRMPEARRPGCDNGRTGCDQLPETLKGKIMAIATANPAANEELYRRAVAESPAQVESPANVMTLQGAVTKTAVLMLLLVATAGFTYIQFRE